MGKRMVRMSLGGFHTTAVDESGALYCWGDNSKGQCGLGELKVAEYPSVVAFNTEGIKCEGVSCGGFFTLFRMVTEASRTPMFYACGLGKEGCLGFGQACKRMLKPQPQPLRTDGRWVYLQAGIVHVVGVLEKVG